MGVMRPFRPRSVFELRCPCGAVLEVESDAGECRVCHRGYEITWRAPVDDEPEPKPWGNGNGDHAAL